MRVSIFVHEKPDGSLDAVVSKDGTEIVEMYRGFDAPGIAARSVNIQLEQQKKIAPKPAKKPAAKKAAKK